MPSAPALYPVNLVLAGRACLVVGGGAVAARKVGGLVAAGAQVHVVATRVGPEVRACAGATWEERAYLPGEATDYRLVVVATDDPGVNRQVAADAEEAGVWVNAADDPASCSFMLPSILRRGPITLAVSTGGRSPALARWLRARFSDELGPEYEVLAEILGEQRDAIRAQGRSTEGLAWHRALESDILDLIRAGEIERARERLQACLSSS
jgi:siroheme synthase-like protein